MRRLALLAGAVAVLVAALWRAWHAGYDAAELAAQAANRRAQARAQAAAGRVVTVYRDRAAQVRTVTRTIHDEIPLFLTADADRRYPLPWGFVRLHDAAAQAVLPGAAAGTDDQASPVALSAAAGVIADNYQTCHLTAARLAALQAWARGVSPDGGADVRPGP